MIKIVEKLEKIATFIKQVNKICDIKKLKTIQLPIKTMQPPFIKPSEMFFEH